MNHLPKTYHQDHDSCACRNQHHDKCMRVTYATYTYNIGHDLYRTGRADRLETTWVGNHSSRGRQSPCNRGHACVLPLHTSISIGHGTSSTPPEISCCLTNRDRTSQRYAYPGTHPRTADPPGPTPENPDWLERPPRPTTVPFIPVVSSTQAPLLLLLPPRANRTPHRTMLAKETDTPAHRSTLVDATTQPPCLSADRENGAPACA